MSMNATIELRKDLEELEDRVRGATARWRHRALDTTRNAAKTADQYVHQNTWTTIAMAAVLGCVIGAVLSRSRR